jgi:hypothetical protein
MPTQTENLTTEDKNFLVMGAIGEYVSMIEDDEEDDTDEYVKNIMQMSDSELIKEADTTLAPQKFYDLWSAYVPLEYRIESTKKLK